MSQKNDIWTRIHNDRCEEERKNFRSNSTWHKTLTEDMTQCGPRP